MGLRLPAACFLAFALALALATAAPAAHGPIFKVSNIGIVSVAAMVEDLRRARVVVVGEQHDNPDHHRAQLAVIRGLHEAGAGVAIGLEMFRADAQEALDRWVDGRADEREFRLAYAANWDPSLWPQYRPIFAYARERGIPLLGLNVPRPLVSQVAREGFASLSGEQREALGVVSCDVDERYRELLGLVVGRKPQDAAGFGRFCEAQVVWDTAMARNVVRYAQDHPDRIVVVLAGTFHAWKHGIPEQLEKLAPLPYRVILPSSDRSYLRYDVMLEDADYVWWDE